MYIVAIGWAYVILMISLTASSLAKGLVILMVLGILPIALFVFAVGGRKSERRSMLVSDQVSDQGDTTNSQRN